MGASLGPCASGDTSFELEVTVPEYYEDDPPGEQTGVSDVVQVRPGIWSVNYLRTSIDWSGASHVHPIYYTVCLVAIDDGLNGGGYGALPWIDYGGSVASWPCNTGSNSSFVAWADSLGLVPGSIINYHVDLNDVSGNGYPCSNDYLFNLGCPNCNQVPVRLLVRAGLIQNFANSRAFKITATGTWIG